MYYFFLWTLLSFLVLNGYGSPSIPLNLKLNFLIDITAGKTVCEVALIELWREAFFKQ